MNQTSEPSAEHTRLQDDREGRAAWKKWGPYLSERQWGTVREDYSSNGDAWNYFSHDNARTEHTGGVRTGSPASPTIVSCFASPWRCGTGAIRSSRNDYSG
jgi:hypothetical protein